MTQENDTGRGESWRRFSIEEQQRRAEYLAQRAALARVVEWWHRAAALVLVAGLLYIFGTLGLWLGGAS